MSLTRRSVLGVAAGLVVAGCRPRRHHPTSAVVADGPAVKAALIAEQGVLAGYDRAIAALDAVAAGPLTAARERHAAHLVALRTLLASPLPSPTASPDPPSQLRLRSSAAEFRAAAVSVQDGHTAALLASIAAEHAADADR